MMLRLATDEDFNNRIVRGLLRGQPDLELVQDEWEGQVRFLPLSS